MKQNGVTFYHDELVVHADQSIGGASVVFMFQSDRSVIYGDRWADTVASNLSRPDHRLAVFGEVHHVGDRVVVVERACARAKAIAGCSSLVRELGDQGRDLAAAIMISMSDREAICVLARFLPLIMRVNQKMIKFSDAVEKEFGDVNGAIQLRRVRG